MLTRLMASLCAAVFLSSLGTAFAAAPMVKTQAPGFYRTLLGDFEVTVLSDGTFKIPVKTLLTHIKPAALDRALNQAFLPAQVETSDNAYLINTGSKLVLIDTGAAGLFGPSLGKLLSNLKAAGYSPEQIDEIYITHLHPDHVGGLLQDGVMAFPNAIVRLDQAEADYWLSEANMKAAGPELQGFFQGAMAALKPYIAADKLKPFVGNTELVPGIRAQTSHGHTAGHSIYVVSSKGEKLVLWGDLIHVAAVQFADPSVTIKFDTDAKAAAQERRNAFADAAKNGYLVGATHVAFPGLGRVRKDVGAKGDVWVPLNYSALQ